MNHNELPGKIRELALQSTDRPKMARLRDIFDDLEFAIKAGVSISMLVETVKQSGLVMTENAFKVALSRIRKERANKTTVPPVETAAGVKFATTAAKQEPPLVKVPVTESVTYTETEILKTGKTNPQDVLKALSSEQRDGAIEKYSVAKVSLKDRLNKPKG